MSAGPAWIAGAYAALEPGLEANAAARDARGLYAELAKPGAFDGLELPYRSALPELSLLDGVQFSRHVVTAIPGTMQRLAHELPHLYAIRLAAIAGAWIGAFTNDTGLVLVGLAYVVGLALSLAARAALTSRAPHETRPPAPPKEL